MTMFSGERTGIRGVLHIARAHTGWITAAVLLTLLASGLALAQPLVVKRLIESATTGPIPWQVPVLLIALFVSQAVVQVFARYVLARTSEGVVLGLRMKLIAHLLRLRIPVYDQHRIGDLISRPSTDAAVLRRVIAEGFADAVTATFGLAGTVAFMIWLDWGLFLVVLGVVTVAALLIAGVLGGIRGASFASQRALGSMTAALDRALAAIRTVRACQTEDRETTAISDHARSAYNASLRMAKLDSVVGPASELGVNGAFLIVLLIGGMRVASGTGSVADLVAFLLYMTYLVMPIDALFRAVSTVQQGFGALQRIDEVLSLPPERDPLPQTTMPPDNQAPVLRFDNVWFGYQAREPVLRGTSFQVPPRSCVALIGRSGAGKSTIFALTERFYDPASGQILLHGNDIRHTSLTAHRCQIGLVEQHSPVLHGTLRDNLLYAAPDAEDGRLWNAIVLADLTDVVGRLPDGLDTEVGERGALLSGGERQRVAIARSLLAGPGLLLLDEPTSHLDADSEAALARALRQVSGTCALLVIAHRFSTVLSADHVVVLDQGVVQASGTHQELLDTDPYYRALARSWARSQPEMNIHSGQLDPRPAGP